MSILLEDFLVKLLNQIKNKDEISSNMMKLLTDMFLLNEFEKSKESEYSNFQSLGLEKNMSYYITGWYVNKMKDTIQ